MGTFENIKNIDMLLNEEELLCQMAEECVELVMAMEDLSSRGIVYGKSIVNGKETTYLDEVEEEIADILLVSSALLEKMKIDELLLTFFAKITFHAEESFQKIGIDRQRFEVKKTTMDVAKLALKLRRAMTKKNPTPISEAAATTDLIYWMAVQNGMMHGMINHFGFKRTYDIQLEKSERWIGRLQGSDVNEQE